jgi:hypothetical protein
MMPRMDRSVAWRAALLQALLLTVTALVLAALLDEQFFRDWGWLAGPGVWAACALVTGACLAAAAAVLVGAALAGVPSLVTVLIGVHWLGALSASPCSVWCGRLASAPPAA